MNCQIFFAVPGSAGGKPSRQQMALCYGYADTPKLDYLLLSGGLGAISPLRDQATLKWLRAPAEKAELIMSGIRSRSRRGVIQFLS